ncbi:MAG: hypothetical protein IJ405_09730 [Lachnospiraceae bacterium]|nr:hypothetical protein [Lachnospiraceae bacterium]
MWNEIVAFYEGYVGTGMLAALFLAAEVYLFVTEKNKTTRIILLYVPVLLLVLFFSPLFAKIVFAFTGDEIYWRILWLVPVVPVLAYAACKIIISINGKKKIVAGVVMALVLMVSGRLVYKNPGFIKAENAYHIPQAVVNLCDAIRGEEHVMAAFPVEHLYYVRQYTESINMAYGREMLRSDWGAKNRLYDLLLLPVLEVEEIVGELRSRQCEYVIFSEEKELNGAFENYDFEFFYETDGYVVYRDALYGR